MPIFNINDVLLALFVLCVAITIKVLNRIPSAQLNSFDSLSRHSPLDGLRGLLALTVFVHHFYITYTWKTTGNWIRPEGNLMNNTGAVSVSLFFLITGYLFLNMLQKPTIDWKKLYLSRIRRIMPLYYLVSLIIIVITLLTIDTTYTTKALVRWLIHWLTFRGDDLAGFPTATMIAAVNWTLIYEWGFYLALPAIYAITQKKIPSKIVLIITVLLCIWISRHTNNSLYLLFAVSYGAIHFKQPIQRLIHNRSKLLNILLPLLLIITLCFTKAYTVPQKLLLGILFAFIVNGYSFFNILNNRSLKLLGDASYSIYLLHGLVLYIAFTLLPGFDFTQSRLHYDLTFPFIYIIVIVISFLSYLYIERPFLNRKNTIHKQ